MKSLTVLFQSLFLALVLATAALAPGAHASGAKVDINRADAATLASGITGIGPAKAEAIVAWREANGPFRSIDQLAEVRGIGLATVERIRDQVTLGTSTRRANRDADLDEDEGEVAPRATRIARED